MAMRKEWSEGYEFGQSDDGRPSLEACPYDIDSEQWHHWMNGYEASIDEMAGEDQ